jgi:murein DD-endopeptidase MepM/ murein hydrolase activator NlpD
LADRIAQRWKDLRSKRKVCAPPPMMQKKIGRSAQKVLLLAGLSLGGLFVLEMGQQMVEALDLGKVASNPASSPVQNLPRKLEIAPTGQLVPIAPLPNRSLPKGKSASVKPVQQPKTAQRHLAINSGDIDPVQQPIAQNINAIQLAAVSSEWSGASFPVEDFQEYTSAFGYRLSPYGGYTQEFHYGLDMAAPEGSYVRNWWAGKVVEVTDNSNCGTSVVLESGPWTHIYCHMEGHVEQTANGLAMIDREGGIQIAEGQQMQAGARIGRVGMSGRTTGPHLHWGLKYEGNWVDPALVLRAMYSSQQASVPSDLSKKPATDRSLW